MLESKAACEESLIEFVRQAWHVIEPGNPFIDGWALQAISEHLEAITYGEINRLLINVPPGMSKSTLTSVMWPAWEWGPCNLPTLRVLGTSHAQSLAIRDSLKMRRLIASPWFQERWGNRVRLTSDQNAKLKFENTMAGFREAAAAGSITGSRGDRVIIDDPHSVESAASDAMRASTTQWFLEAIPTRLTDPANSAIIVIMQRLHEEDVSGVILNKDLGYEHLMLPMEFDSSRRCATSIGFEDPREEDGELLFPERFPRDVVERDKLPMGTYAVSGQFQQSPAPRGGGILKRSNWMLWDAQTCREQGVKPIVKWDSARGENVEIGTYPPFKYILASLDTAYTEKQENDPCALTVWGVWQNIDGFDRIMLINAWAQRFEFHPLVREVMSTCQRFKPHMLLIESKAAGHSVEQEIRRLAQENNARWSVQLHDPGRGDKSSRAYAVQPIFEAGLVYAPDRAFAEMVISQCEVFPKGAHDDLVDTTTQAIAKLRSMGFAKLPFEQTEELDRALRNWKRPKPLYEV